MIFPRRYLYTNDYNIKAGALLAIGLVNCGIRNECDPALALLSDYVSSENATLRIGATLGLGLAYAGSQRSDVTELLTGVLVDNGSTLMDSSKKESFRAICDEQFLGSMEVMSLGAIAIGLINVGSADAEASSTLLQKLLEFTPQKLSSTHSRLKRNTFIFSLKRRRRKIVSNSFFIQISVTGTGNGLHGLSRCYRGFFGRT